MKSTLATVLATALLGTACAPVATSVPKLIGSSPRSADAILAESGGRIGVLGTVSVQSMEKSAEFEKGLVADGYSIAKNKFNENDRKFSDLRELQSMEEIPLPPSIIRADIKVVFVVKANAKGISENLSDDLNLEWNRNDKNEVSFKVNRDGLSGEAWTKVKANLVSVMIASREAKLIK